jgi:hypothetical protein
MPSCNWLNWGQHRSSASGVMKQRYGVSSYRRYSLSTRQSGIDLLRLDTTLRPIRRNGERRRELIFLTSTWLDSMDRRLVATQNKNTGMLAHLLSLGAIKSAHPCMSFRSHGKPVDLPGLLLRSYGGNNHHNRYLARSFIVN